MNEPTMATATGGAPVDSQIQRSRAIADADRDRAVAHKTRRVVLASLGILNDLKAGHKRNRAVAVAAILVLFSVMALPLWFLFYSMFADDNTAGVAWEIAVSGFFLCCGLVGSALLVGWLRARA